MSSEEFLRDTNVSIIIIGVKSMLYIVSFIYMIWILHLKTKIFCLIKWCVMLGNGALLQCLHIFGQKLSPQGTVPIDHYAGYLFCLNKINMLFVILYIIYIAFRSDRRMTSVQCVTHYATSLAQNRYSWCSF